MDKPEDGPIKATDIFEPLLDSQQAADLMHVHPETVKRRAHNGEIPGMKFGKVWRFRASGLEAYIRNLIR
jgi:excisionase family DNA binding protein